MDMKNESGVFITEDGEEFEYTRQRFREDMKYYAEQHGEIRTEIIVGTDKG